MGEQNETSRKVHTRNGLCHAGVDELRTVGLLAASCALSHSESLPVAPVLIVLRRHGGLGRGGSGLTCRVRVRVRVRVKVRVRVRVKVRVRVRVSVGVRVRIRIRVRVRVRVRRLSGTFSLRVFCSSS